MNCKNWNEAWVAYLYDECSAEERNLVEEHLGACDDCRRQMDELDATRQVLGSAAAEVATPPRVIVLPAARRKAVGIWGFAGGFASAAALFIVGMFVGMQFFSSQTTVLETAGLEDIGEPAATAGVVAGRDAFDSGIQQVRNDFRGLDDRLGRVERWLPESQGDTLPRLATEDRLQVAVGNLFQELDVRRTKDLQLFMQAIYAAEQTARQRDVTLSQAIEIMYAENNPNARQR